jgi:hypothetical protein
MLILHSSHSRNRDDKPGAALRPVLRAYAAAVQLDEMLDDGQSEAGTTGIAGARFLDAIEALEHAGQIAFGNPGALVRYGNRHASIQRRRGHVYRGLFGCIGDGIGNEISQRVVQLAGIDPDFLASRRCRRQRGGCAV